MTHPSSPTDPAELAVDAAQRASRWAAIDHVQLAIPPGGESQAREFWVGTLGFEEQPKPPVMAARGGAWFVGGSVKIHVGSDEAFVPARKAHPALAVTGLAKLVEHSGLTVRWDTEIEGLLRCHVDDPFGNRIELVDVASVTASIAAGS